MTQKSPKGVGEMEEWQQRVNQDISELKQGQAHASTERTKMRDDIRDLQYNDRIQEQEIKALKEDISSIKDDTNWIRRKITGAIITATITAVVAGIIGIAIANIF